MILVIEIDEQQRDLIQQLLLRAEGEARQAAFRSDDARVKELNLRRARLAAATSEAVAEAELQ